MCFDNDCGFFGECIEDICVCEEGWSNSYDSLLHISSEVLDNDDDFARLPCTEHKLAIQIIYASAAALSLIAIIDLSRSLKRRSQVKRALPGIVALLGAAVLGIYRTVATKRENVLGHDIFINLLLAIAFPVIILRSLVFVNKYIVYQRSLIGKSESKSSRTTLINKVVILLAFCNVFILLTALFYRKESLTRANIFRFGMGIGIIMSLWVIIVSYSQFTFFIKQLKALQTNRLETSDQKLLIKYFTAIMWTVIFIYSVFVVFTVVVAASIRTLRLTLWLTPAVLYLLVVGELVLNNLIRRASSVNKRRIKIVQTDDL